MRKYFSELCRLFWGISLFLLAVFSGCDKDFDEVVDVSFDNFQVISVTGIKDTVDLKNPSDSLLTLRLRFTPESRVNKVYFDIIASDNNLINSSPVQMTPAGNNIFEKQFVLRSSYPIGNYSIRFSVTDINGENEQVAVGYFYFNNGQDNVAPVISNLVMPDSVQAGQTILYHVEASDSNGLNDISFVFYVAYNPNGDRVVNSQGIFEFPMFDDGDTQVNGDATAGDGIFTVVLTFPASAQTGTWKFDFRSRDRSGVLSNLITHIIEVTN